MKTFFASFLGTLFALAAAIVIVVIFIVALVPSEKPVAVKEKAVLHLTLDGAIDERSAGNSMGAIASAFRDNNTGLNDILAAIKNAKTDDKIKGIYLDFSIINAGYATVEEIRNALLDFKSSGKFIYSFSEVYTQKAYYLASVADKLIVNPGGLIEFKGLGGQLLFFKGLLQKLDIDMQVFRHGKFKSAVEPFESDKMSEANRKQTLTYISSIWNRMLEGVATQRKLTVAELNSYADKMLIQDAGACVRYKLADDTLYKDQFLDQLRTKIGIKPAAKINFVSLHSYVKSMPKSDGILKKDKIAVIYAVGDIVSGIGESGNIGSDVFSKLIREARTDSAIKAIVLRVNSPGGGALASDVIWREVLLAKQVKPVIVSMGDVAASGGYYIACAADVIVAQPNTITGSIGVFGLLPNVQKFLNNKLGITVDTVSTNKHANLGSMLKPVDKEEAVVIQNAIERIYKDFISRVAAGRKMNTVTVDSIAQGRVWSGVDALRIGLVDTLGGINDAIKLAAKHAHLTEYRLVDYPKLKDPLENLLHKISGDQEEEVKLNYIKSELGSQYIYYQQLKSILNIKGIQTRMPFELILN